MSKEVFIHSLALAISIIVFVFLIIDGKNYKPKENTDYYSNHIPVLSKMDRTNFEKIIDKIINADVIKNKDKPDVNQQVPLPQIEIVD